MKTNDRKWNTILKVFMAAVGIRLAVYLVSVVLMVFHTQDGETFGLEQFLAGWTKWDAYHYINIAENGYSGAVENGEHLFLVFFPLFPYVLRFAHLFIADIRLAGMVVSTLTFAGGSVYFYLLMWEEYDSKTAWNALLLMACFPFGFFFGGVLTEGVFFLVSAGMLYYLRKHKWWMVVVFGIFATMSRMQGILLGIPVVVELFMTYQPFHAWKEKQYKKIGQFFARGCSMALMYLGTVYYLFINWKTEGDPLRFMYYQKNHWSMSLCSPIETVSYVIRLAFGNTYTIQTKMAIMIPNFCLLLFSVLVLVYGIKRVRPTYLCYGIVYVLLTYSTAWLLSGGRYLACCLPFFMILASRIKNTAKIQVIAMIFLMLQMAYLSGYLAGYQIM